jgi:hypothetical protein
LVVLHTTEIFEVCAFKRSLTRIFCFPASPHSDESLEIRNDSD